MHNPNFKEYLEHPVTKRVLASGPKRILALDGGGVRGALSLGVLEEMEDNLRHRFDIPEMVLSDYYDMIGGTSTGAIIATLLALGKEVSYVKDLYLNLGQEIFSKKRKPYIIGYLRFLLAAEYDESILEKYLDKELGSLTLGSETFKTGLCIFSKRADTYSTWAFHNHPRNAYYEDNKMLKIKDLLRATSAAPSYFKSKRLDFGDGSMGYFIDGGVSMVNNPSLMLFMMTTIEGYGYQWKTGAKNLLITSVGTGYKTVKLTGKNVDKLAKKRTLTWAPELPNLFMKDADELNQFVLQYFSHPMIPQRINAEANDLQKDLISSSPLLEYCRYNVKLEDSAMRELGFELDENILKNLQELDHGENVDYLYKIGRAYAKKMVDPKHFPVVFDYGINTIHLISDQEKVKKMFIPLIKANNTLYEKYNNIKARQATESEIITTITKHGVETSAEAKPHEYIVQNFTDEKEAYIIKEDQFDKRYTFIKNLEDNWSLYKPKGKIYALEMTEKILHQLDLPFHFNIQAAWGKKQYVSFGDFLASPEDFSEVYRIDRTAFHHSYHLINTNHGE